MAPKSKGTKVNLRDLQRELRPDDALPIAPRPAEEREEEREKKWSRYEKEAGGSGRWADREVDGESDSEWRRDARPPKKEEAEVDFRGARGSKFIAGGGPDEDAGFANLRRGVREAKKEKDDEDVDFSTVRSMARKPKPKDPKEEPLDFSSARSGGPKRDAARAPRDEGEVDFSCIRTGVKSTQKIEPDRERARGLRDVVAAVVAGEAPVGEKYVPPSRLPPTETASAAADADSLVAARNAPARQDSATGAPRPSQEAAQQQQQQQQQKAKKEAAVPQKAQDSTSPSSGGESAATEAAAADSKSSNIKQQQHQQEPRWKRQASSEAEGPPKPSVKEDPVVLEPVRLSSLRGAAGSGAAGVAATAAAAAASAAAGTSRGGENKYVPPCLRKDGAAGSSKQSPLQQQGSNNAVRKLLSCANAARDAAVAAEMAERKKLEAKAEERKQQLLEKQRLQKEELVRRQNAFRCSDDDAMHAFVAKAQQMLEGAAPNSAEGVEACIGLLPEADKGSLAAPLCVIGLVYKAGYGCKNCQGVREKGQRVAPLIKRLLSDAVEALPEAYVMIIQQLVILANELRCPRLSADTALVEAVFDFLLFEGLIPQQDFVSWLEDVDDETPGRNAVMFQISSWGLWLRGELGPMEEASASEEDNDDDIEALVPKRGVIKLSRRRY